MLVVTEPRVVGRYELHGELASGGMATVYLGRSIGSAGFQKSVAIKRLHENFARDPDFVSLLLEEARLSERIRHANVVAVLDVIQAESELLLVMEYVHGETLARLLRACAQDGERCPPEVAASVAHGVLLGLHAAHNATDAAGNALCIIHRDVSPQNIIVGTDGVARLLDFGIAKATGSASGTREGQVKGKVPYMAPEVLQLSPASVQSDIYAVGVTLWESLCAKRLFRADTEIGLWGLVLAGNIARPSTFIGPIGPLEDVIMRSLAKDRAERYPNALEMAQAIEACTRLASPTEIAAWVRKRAADSLAERSSAVQVIDSMRPRATADSSSRNVARHDSIATAASGTASTVSTEVLTGTATGSRPWLMRTVVALLAFAIVALVALRGLDARRNRTGGTTPELGTSPVVGVVSASLSAPSAGVPPVLAASVASASVPAATRATEPPASAEVAATPALDSTGAKRRPPRPVAPAAPATSFVRPVQDPCDPPFSLDAQGRKHFKLNCVN